MEKIKLEIIGMSYSQSQSGAYALILGEIARLNDLDIDEKEIEEGFEDVSREAGYPAEAIRKYYESNNLIDTFKQTLLKEKTLNYLVENASVKEIEPAENKEND